MFSSPWHLLLFDRLGVTIIGTLTIIGGKAVMDDRRWCTCNSLTREVADTNSLTQLADNMQIRYGRLNKRYTSFLTIFYKMEA